MRVRTLVLGLAIAAGVVWLGARRRLRPRTIRGSRGASTTLDSKDLGVSRRRFEAGARSAWHSHDKGQLLFVEKGRARLQKRGESMRELGEGESDYTGPSVAHWHGATPHEPYVQVAVGFGGETRWMEKVTDEEYEGKKR